MRLLQKNMVKKVLFVTPPLQNKSAQGKINGLQNYRFRFLFFLSLYPNLYSLIYVNNLLITKTDKTVWFL